MVSHFILTVILLIGACDLVSMASTTISPLSIPPSEFWKGNDGLWSTFMIEIGSPGQMVEVLPGSSATAGNSIWVILPQDCTVLNPGLANCESSRGHFFLTNQSTTWSTSHLSNRGIFSLPTLHEEYLNLTGSAFYGFDTVRLGGGGTTPGLPNVPNQIIAGIATNDFWLGSLGLSPLAFNFTNLNDPRPSLLGSLRERELIPSSSWAYHAGAWYREPPTFGSLTLGGYDASRRSNRSTVSIPFGPDISRDLLVGLQSITYNSFGSSPLLANGVYAFIDSMVSQMWLPVEVCHAFERQFNLTWNETAELYPLTENQHAALLAQDPTFTFKVGPSASGGEHAEIVLPYTAFDLSASAPLVPSETRYFPLKRAYNNSQYTLGRVFLQEAYIVADYDRQNFSISQAVFPDPGNSQQIVAIEPPAASDGSRRGFHPSSGVILGMVVGGVIILVIMIMLFAQCRTCETRPQQKMLPEPRWSRPFAPGHRHEMSRDGQLYEPDSRQGYPEMPASAVVRQKHPLQTFEMYAGRRSAVELEASNWI